MSTPAEALRRTLEGREVYLFGAGQQGRGMARLFEREGIVLRGFIDNSDKLRGTTVEGYPVLRLEAVLPPTGGAPRPFLVLAAFFFEADLRRQCREAGLREGADYVSYKELKPYDYVVDVSGVCNLRCVSCPRTTRTERHPPPGFMSAESFRRVLGKILRDDPLVGSIQLYQWGEPTLNPELPEIIRACNDVRIPCAISSNLNVKRDLEPIVAAGPSWFRVSVSGFGKEYEVMHTGGRWSRLEPKLRELARLRRELAPDMKTEVFYHLYRHNQGESRARMSELCDELGFEFHPVWAYLLSLDDMLEKLEGGTLSREAQRAADMLALGLEDGMALARAQQQEACPVLRQIQINWDRSVSNCMMYFYPQDNVAATDFLETSVEAISAARQGCSLCRRCIDKSLHQYCTVYNTEAVSLAEERP